MKRFTKTNIRREIDIYYRNGKFVTTVTRTVYKGLTNSEYVKYNKIYYKLDIAFNRYTIWI